MLRQIVETNVSYQKIIVIKKFAFKVFLIEIHPFSKIKKELTWGSIISMAIWKQISCVGLMMYYWFVVKQAYAEKGLLSIHDTDLPMTESIPYGTSLRLG